jgi:hypothetical protein
MKTNPLFPALLAAFGMMPAQAGANVELEVLNRYVDQGGDVEPGSRFLRAGIGTELHGVDIGLEGFQALGSGNYNEIGLTFSMDFEFGDLVLTPGVTFLWFPDDSEDTLETSLGFELPLFGTGLEFFGEYVYDLNDSVGFLEVGLALPQTVPAGDFEISVTPSVTVGFDYGMVSGDRGFTENNVVVSLEIGVPVTEQFEVFASINQSYALTAIEDGRDISWFGLGVALGF